MRRIKLSERKHCVGKVRHRNKGGAMKHIRLANDPELSPYRCQYCAGWHVGHGVGWIQKREFAGLPR